MQATLTLPDRETFVFSVNRPNLGPTVQLHFICKVLVLRVPSVLNYFYNCYMHNYN